MSVKELKLKPNEILFSEGDVSKNLYFLKSGTIRVFKKKGEGTIEIETIRTGQVIGEMAFFDGQPRSASAEALTSSELIEISRAGLDEALTKFPEWLVSLTKTVSIRLRAANNRIRLLEGLSTEYEIDKHGNRSKEFVFITTAELLRFCTALLVVGSRYGKNATTEGIEITDALLERFASPILQVNSNKVISLIELFKKVDILKGNLLLTDIRFVDQLIQHLNEQNLLDHTKKQTLSEGGFSALKLVMQQKGGGTEIPDTSFIKFNIAPGLAGSKLQASQIQELVDQKIVERIDIKSADEMFATVDSKKLIFLYRTFWMLNEVAKLNEEKRKS